MTNLPDRANLAYLKKQAKDLIRLYRDRDPEAIARLRHALPAATGRSDEEIAALELRLPAILSRNLATLEKVVDQSLRCKAAVVSRDEREGDLRKILNFGHTVGHAIEAASDYTRYLHGEAVAIGMVVAARLSRLHAGLAEADQQRLRRLIEGAGLPTGMPDLRSMPAAEHDRFTTALNLDKKRAGDAIDFVLVPEIGRAIVRNLSFEQISAVLEQA